MAAVIKAAALALALCLMCSCSLQTRAVLSDGALLSDDAKLTFSESDPPALSAPEPEPEPPAPPLSEKAAAVRLAIERDREALDKAVAEVFYKYSAVGASVTAFVGEEPVYTFCYGLADKEHDIPVTGDTKFRAASVSKLLTTLVCLMETEQGGLSLASDVRELIGGGLFNPYYPDEPVTLEQLLTHTSGFYDGGPYLHAVDDGGNFPSLESLTRDMKALTCSEPGKEWVYSNFGIGLVAGAVEASCGERFSDRAEEMVFGPLGLDAGFTPDFVDDPGTLANIYLQGELRVDPRDWLGMKGAYKRIPIGQMYLLGQGELYISSEDLARAISILAGDGSCGGKSCLSSETLVDMHRVRVEGKQGRYSIRQALGVREYADLIDGRTLNGHEGQAYGMVSGAIYERSARCGIAVLTNGCSSQMEPCGVKSVNAELVRLLWNYIGTEART